MSPADPDETDTPTTTTYSAARASRETASGSARGRAPSRLDSRARAGTVRGDDDGPTGSRGDGRGDEGRSTRAPGARPGTGRVVRSCSCACATGGWCGGCGHGGCARPTH
jgi:hypothetical protein